MQHATHATVHRWQVTDGSKHYYCDWASIDSGVAKSFEVLLGAGRRCCGLADGGAACSVALVAITVLRTRGGGTGGGVALNCCSASDCIAA
jgi:hypothetical protein